MYRTKGKRLLDLLMRKGGGFVDVFVLCVCVLFIAFFLLLFFHKVFSQNHSNDIFSLLLKIPSLMDSKQIIREKNKPLSAFPAVL